MADGGVSHKNGSKDSSDRAVQQLQVIWTCYRCNDVCEVMTGRAGQLKSPSASADGFVNYTCKMPTKTGYLH